jgi:hypothetical protein
MIKEVPGYNEGVIKQQLANLKASGDYARIMREVERETVNGSCRGSLCRARVASHSDARCPQHLSPKPWLWRAGTPVPRRSRFVPTLEIPLRADAALLQTPSPVSLGKQRSMQASRSAEQGSILVDCLIRGKQEAAGSIARVAAPDIEELVIAALPHQVEDIDRQVVSDQTSPLRELSDRDLVARQVERIVLRSRHIDITLRGSLRLNRFPQRHDARHFPKVLGHASGHCRSDA